MLGLAGKSGKKYVVTHQHSGDLSIEEAIKKVLSLVS
jgi:hypothetical protein